MNEVRRKYYREYSRERYHNDPVFRDRQIAAIQNWQDRNPKKIKQYRINQNIAYANRTPSQIKKRKLYLKKLRRQK